jgi:hypothetical protein
MNRLSRLFWAATTTITTPETTRLFWWLRHRRDHKHGNPNAVHAARVAWHEQAGYGEGCFTDAQYYRVIQALRAGTEPCHGGKCEAWDPHGDRPVALFCRRHCPDCRSPLAAPCRWHISAGELGERILAGMPSEYSSLADD